MTTSYCSYGMEKRSLVRSRSGVGVGVGDDIFSPESELESESLEIHRLRSPASNIQEGTSLLVFCFDSIPFHYFEPLALLMSHCLIYLTCFAGEDTTDYGCKLGPHSTERIPSH